MGKIKSFLKEWWAILLAAIFLGVVYFMGKDIESVVKDLSGGLLVEVLGAVLTLLLIDRVLKKNEERKRTRMEKAALKGFRFTIIDILNMFWNMRRAAAKKPLDSAPKDWREAISSDESIDDLRHLDLLSDAGLHPPAKWNNHVTESFQNKYLPAIRRVVESYSPFLSAKLIEELEALNGDVLFSRLFLQANGFSSAPIPLKKIPLALCPEPLLRGAISKLLDIMDTYNCLCPDIPIIFHGMDLSENTNPLVGTGRCEFSGAGDKIIVQ